ncbi:MAG: DUF5060 domain-containing protein [Pseudomonadota bacterium]
MNQLPSAACIAHLMRCAGGVALVLLSLGTGLAHAAQISGSLITWHPLTVDFVGPEANERDDAPNPFLDYRLTVEWTGPDGQLISVPGFFAGDGSGGATGDVWRVRFAPEAPGTWQYTARFRSGEEVAISLDPQAGEATGPDGETGSVDIAPIDPDASGFLPWGRLEYVGEHYPKFRDGPYWLKGGVDSPENFLGYAGFHNTEDQGGINSGFLHEYAPHRQDFSPGDPEFFNEQSGVDSEGIIGALNYLASAKVNSIYFLPMNLGGDGQETYPFVGPADDRFDKTHYDIRKLYEWNLVLNHAQEQGISPHFVLAETESPNEQWLDDGTLGVERKLYYRELIARFAYLLTGKWNLSEENDYNVSALREFADYLRALDWSGKHIAVHTKPNNFRDYDEIVGEDRFDATSIQYAPDQAGDHVETWRQNSAAVGRPWILDMDENNPAGSGLNDENAEDLRKRVLYDVYFSGGAIEWYFGYHDLPLGGDMRTEDFRTRAEMYDYMWYARRFLEEQVPFWEMAPNDALLSGEAGAFGGGEVLAKVGEAYAIYLPDADPAGSLDLGGVAGSFVRRWYDPVTGEFAGEPLTLLGGAPAALGTSPSRPSEDWVALILRDDDAPPPPPPDFAVVELALIDADLDQPIPDQDPLADGATLNLATLPTRNLNVVARTDGEIGSVRFLLDGAVFSTENVAPYALAGDSNGDFNAWTPPLGELTITATAYAGEGAGGEVGGSVMITLDVVDEAPPPPVFTLSPTAPGEAGVVNEWETLNGSPGGVSLIFAAGNEGDTPITVGNCEVTLALASERRLAGAQADPEGRALASRPLPISLAGRTLYFQALDLQSCTLSNVTQSTL